MKSTITQKGILTVLNLVAVCYGQLIHTLPNQTIFQSPPDPNNVYSAFDIQHQLSESIYAAAKIEYPIPNTYPPSFSTTDFWPSGSWGRGYYTQTVEYQPENEDDRYQQWYSYVDNGNTKYWACYPLIRDTGRRIIGYINAIKNVHYTTDFDNMSDKIKNGIEYLLNSQATDGGFYYYQNRLSYDNPANENPITEIYPTGIAMRALYEGYNFLNDIMNDNSLNIEIQNSIESASSYLINHDYKLHISGWGHGGPNMKYFAVWGLISAFKLTGNVDYYNYAKSVAESSFGYHRDDGSWESPVSDSNGPCSITYYKWHDTRIYYHGITIRGLSELYSVIINDVNFKNTVKEHIVRSINHIIDYNGLQGNPTSRLYSQNGVYNGRVYMLHRDEIDKNCDPLVGDKEIDGQIISGLVNVRNLVDFSDEDTENLDQLINCIANGMADWINDVTYLKRVWHCDQNLMGLGKYIGNIKSVNLSNRDLTEINLGGTLSIDQKPIPSGNSHQFLSYNNDLHDLRTDQPELSGKKHLEWNHNMARAKLKEIGVDIVNEIDQAAYFTDQHNISISSNINISIQIQDPWYLQNPNNPPAEWIQTGTDWIAIDSQTGQYQVFLDQDSNQGMPTYSLKAPSVGQVTQNDILVFGGWTVSPSNGATLNTNQATTTVVFHDVGSPVTITANYISALAEGKTVVIESNEELVLPANSNYIIQNSNFGFQVNNNGTLKSQGTLGNPVTLKMQSHPQYPQFYGWDGITVEGGELDLSYTVIMDAKKAVDILPDPNPGLLKSYWLDHTVIAHCDIGIREQIINTGNRDFRFTNNTFVDNYVEVSGNYPVIKNNIYSNCTFILNGNINSTVTHNDFFQTTVTPSSLLSISTNITVNPLFTSTTQDDYTLISTSPCIDAGSEGCCGLDPDGTQPDMGAYYYDAPPAAPTGFIISGSVGQHPTGSWAPNPELDLAGYKLYKNEANSSWVLLQTLDVSTTSYTDNSVTIGPGGRFSSNVCYKVSDYDLAGQESSYSVPRCKPLGSVGKSTVNFEIVPDEYALHAAFPNPFNPTTTIRFDLPERSRVTMVIYDVLGRTIRTLIQNTVDPGFNEIRWDGKDDNGSPLPSGMYIYRFSALSEESEKQFNNSNKLVLMK